jgi:site-specific recombinase XerD
MASVKIILRKRANKNCTHALVLQIIKDRKKSIIHLGHHVKQSDWDDTKKQVKKSHPNSARLNAFLLTKHAEAMAMVLEQESQKDTVSAKALKNKIKPQTGVSFIAQSQDYLDTLKSAGKYNQYTADKARINRFRQYLKQDISFSDITPGLLNKFDAFLRNCTTGKINKKKLSERTIVNHMAVIRSVFAHARRNGVITKEQSPFGGDGGVKIKFPDSTKTGPSESAIARLEELRLEDPRHEHARKLWLFSFYFAGMRVSDVFRLRWSDFVNYRLVYSMGKNNKVSSLKIPDKAVQILKHYEQFKVNGDDLVFPELKNVDFNDEFKTQRTIAFKTSALDKVLRKYVAPAAGIKEKLTMHMARHSFGELAGDAIPIQMLQKLYRHSNVATTIGYQSNFIHKEADDALDAVLRKVDKMIRPES